MAGQSLLMSMSAAARALGHRQCWLSRLSRRHPFYAPMHRGMPTGFGRVEGARTAYYHPDQVALIRRVMCGALDLETAWLEWQVARNRIAEGDAPCTSRRTRACTAG